MGGGCSKSREYAVTVHVYRLIGDNGVPLIELMDASGFGVFHSGVEVGGKEYSFGGDCGGSPGATGMYSQAPRQLPAQFAGATYKESVGVGATLLSPAELKGILSGLRREWRAEEYDLLQRNCNHFTAAACAALGVAPPPAYINRLASAGSGLVRAAGAAMSMLGGLAAMAAAAAAAAAAAQPPATPLSRALALEPAPATPVNIPIQPL